MNDFTFLLSMKKNTEMIDYTNESFIGILTEDNKQHNLDKTQLLPG